MPLADPAIIGDEARLKRLHQLALMDSAADPAFDRLTRLASKIIGAPISLVSLVDVNRQFFKSEFGLGEPLRSQRGTTIEYSYCQHVVASHSPLIVSDARLDPRLYDNPAIAELNAIAYAGMPLMTSDGQVLGSFCVVDNVPREWTPEQIEILRELSLAAMTEIELREQLLERQLIEQELRDNRQQLIESQRFVERLIHTLPDVVYLFDLDLAQIVYVNTEIDQVLGYSQDEYQTFSGEKLYSLVHRDDQPALRQAIHQRAGLKDGEFIELDYRIRTAGGSYLWVHAREAVFLRDEQGGVRQVVGVVQDISRRKQDEAMLRGYVNSLEALRHVDVELGETLDLNSVVEVAMDAALRISAADDAFIALAHEDSFEVLAGVGGYKVGMRFERGQGIVERVLRSHTAEIVDDVTDDPDYVPVIQNTISQMCIPLTHRDRMIGVIGLESRTRGRFTHEALQFLTLVAGRITIAIDNAQLYARSQEQLLSLAELYQRVSDLEQMKTDMIRIAAHDLRNPLGVVLGYSELLMESDPVEDPPAKDFIRNIHNGGQKMKKIIDDILALQRSEVAAANATHEKVDLNALVQAAFADQEAAAQTKCLRYTLEPSDSPLPLTGDPGQLHEAIVNLINNAIKYTPEGGQVSVRVYREGKSAVFEVRDTGYGIPEEAQARLFQPFYRVPSEQTARIDGTGLGLHLVRNIVSRHFGRMRFSSKVGEGSLFGFEIPLMR